MNVKIIVGVSESMQGHVGKIMAEIAGCAVRYARQCMCPAMKCKVPHERCIGGMHRDYNHV